MNFYDLLVERAKTFGNKTFLRVDDEIFSYEDFLAAVDGHLTGCKFVTQAVNFFAAQKSGKIPVLLHDGTTKIFGGDGTNCLGVLTSGSTSAPKFLFRTFASWADFFSTQNKIFRVDAATKLFMHGSLSFTGNLNAFLATLDAGGTIVTSEKFAPKTWLELVADATNIYLVPTKLILLATGTPLDNIRAIFTGSQVLSAAQSLSLLKKFPAAELILYYGATELNYITYKKISAENAGEVQNLGRAFDGVKIFVRDGLIYVDTKFHVSGFDNPGTVGDAGFIDGHGDLIFLGRGEDFINRGGVKVFASAVEQKLLTIDGVTAAAVVKVPDETRGENFLAFVVGTVDKKTIRQALTPAELPREIIFVDELPLNSSGKVDKKRLLAQMSQT
ncbi:MAG: AMP-binding protein [Selenomonadaceae bacterium]|nr:AMP-binding protein [Selenomonadaceae bacterium]